MFTSWCGEAGRKWMIDPTTRNHGGRVLGKAQLTFCNFFCYLLWLCAAATCELHYEPLQQPILSSASSNDCIHLHGSPCLSSISDHVAVTSNALRDPALRHGRTLCDLFGWPNFVVSAKGNGREA